MPGPPPKRDAERRRRNKDAVPTETVDIASLVKLDVEIPVAEEEWHPIARQWYDSLARSGQAVFYEPSDWMTAFILAEQIDRALKPVPVFNEDGQIVVDPETGRAMVRSVPMPGAAMNAILKGFSALMVTEGDRRRLSIELERKRGEEALPEGVASISKTRQRRLG